MKFNIFNWFRRPRDREYSEVERFMSQINADVSDDVRSVLSTLSRKEEEQLKKLYHEIFKYKKMMSQNDKKESLMNSSFILNAISANACDLDNTKKIFDFVKSWDSETFLPKGIRMILRNQISDEEIKELESLYKRYNIKVKDIFKDKANYYYTSSQDFKNEITKVFGNAANTLALLLKADEIDNRKKVSKDLVEFFEKLLNNRDVDGRLLNKIIFCKIRNVDNDYVVEDNDLNDMFEMGLIDSGNVLKESITTKYVSNIYDVLTILKTNEARYGGVVVLEIPNIYLDKDEVIGEYSDKVYVNSEYQRINPSFIKGYISINFDKCEFYTKEEVLNKELDMPNLKGEKKNNKNTSQE